MKERLMNLPTLRVNPDVKIPFTYRAKHYNGMAGDSIATALHANGIRIFSGKGVNGDISGCFRGCIPCFVS